MDVIRDYFDGVLERNPHIASVLGEHRYDSRIPDGSRSAVKTEINEAKKTRDKLDTDSWEHRIALAALEYDIFEMESLRLWEMNPGAVNAIISFIYPLWSRNYASLNHRIERIADRLEDCPTYLKETRERVSHPVELWVKDEIEMCGQLPGFLQLIADYAGDMERQDVAYRVNAAAEDTLEALDEYREWLESLDPDEEWRIGEEDLEELLEKRLLPPPNEIVDLAEEELERAENNMEQAVEGMGYDDPRDVLEELEPGAVDKDRIVDNYTREIREAREFVREEEIASLPTRDAVEVTETPEHLRPLIPLSGYIEPPPLDGSDEPARYYITPNKEHLEEHSPIEVLGTAISEFYPGHHLQQAYTKESRTAAIVGKFNSFGDDFVEGWELYCMDTMSRHGYRDHELNLVRSRDRVGAACKAIVDIELQRGGMSVREASDFLADEVGLDPQQAVAQVRNYTQNPGHQTSRIVGAHLLNELRKDNESMPEKAFHDSLLRGGGIPVQLHREKISF